METKTFVIIGGIVLLFFGFFILTAGGIAGIGVGISVLMGLVKIGLVVGAIGIAVYFLFKYKKETDVNAEVNKEWIDSAEKNRDKTLGKLIVSGDSQHKKRQVGKIIGNFSTPLEQDEMLNIFLVSKIPFKIPILTFFLKMYFMVIVREKECSPLMGDIVIKANGIRRMGYIYVPDIYYNDYQMIDVLLYKERTRWIQNNIMKFFYAMIRKAMGVDPEDYAETKAIEGMEMFNNLKRK